MKRVIGRRSFARVLGSGVFVAAALAWSAGAQAATITVARTGDTTPGTRTGTCSLRMAVERANGLSNSCGVSGGGAFVINVPASGTAYAISGANGRIRVRRSMTIQGTSANNSSTMIRGDASGGGAMGIEPGLTSETLTLRNLRFTNFRDINVNGGAVSIASPSPGNTYTVNVDVVQIDHCLAWTGGAIYNEAGVMTITNSSIHDNNAGFGGAIWHSSPSLTVTNTTLTNNTVDQNGGSGLGGALYNAGVAAINQSTFTNNRALVVTDTGDGGAIYTVQGADLTVRRSTLNGNSARNGGAIFQDGINQLRVYNSTISGNTAAFSGGGIYSIDYVEIYLSTVVFNHAANGGGVYSGASSGGHTSACIIGNNTPNDYEGDPHGAYSMSDRQSSISSSSGIINSMLAYCQFDPIYCAPLVVDQVSTIALGPLTNNGGPTSTHAIGTGSPAYNRVVPVDCPAVITGNVDQRGVTRPRAGSCDRGAFEL